MKTRIALPSWSCFLLLISKFLIVCDLQGQELWINGSAANNDVNYVTNGFVNFGTIRMESTDGAYASDLTVTSGALTNAASGVVNINIGSGGERVIAASMLNLGAFNANDSMAFSQSNASIANSGQFNIASGATVSINGDGQVFNQNGGALTNGGGMELNGAQFNFNGGVIAGNPLYLLNSALNISPSSSNSPGSFIVTGGGGTYGGDLWPGQAIWIQGNQTGGHTVLTSATGFNNSGSILLESGDAGYESSLAVLNGVLINTVPGVINILAGTGGVRNVDANFINYGAFNVSNSLGISYTNGVYDNEGAFEVASDAVVTINGENQTFIQGSGGLQIDGEMDIENMVFQYNGGAISGAAGAPYLIDSILEFGSSTGSGAATFWLTGSASSMTGNVPPGRTVWVRGSAPGSHTTVVVTNGFINAGTLTLESVDAGYDTLFYLNNGALFNATNGTVNINAGTGGSRVFGANLVNQGVFNDNTSASLSVSNGVYENDGAFNIAAGQTLTISGQNQVFNQDNGALQLDGALNLFGVTLNYNGGAIGGASGVPMLVGSQLNLGAQATNPAQFWLTGSASSMTGDIKSGQTVWVGGSASGSFTTFVVTNGFVNAGTLRLESADAGYDTLFYVNNGVLTNGPTGITAKSVG